MNNSLNDIRQEYSSIMEDLVIVTTKMKKLEERKTELETRQKQLIEEINIIEMQSRKLPCSIELQHCGILKAKLDAYGINNIPREFNIQLPFYNESSTIYIYISNIRFHIQVNDEGYLYTKTTLPSGITINGKSLIIKCMGFDWRINANPTKKPGKAEITEVLKC